LGSGRERSGDPPTWIGFGIGLPARGGRRRGTRLIRAGESIDRSERAGERGGGLPRSTEKGRRDLRRSGGEASPAGGEGGVRRWEREREDEIKPWGDGLGAGGWSRPTCPTYHPSTALKIRMDLKTQFSLEDLRISQIVGFFQIGIHFNFCFSIFF
jgi:hypothetical protein